MLNIVNHQIRSDQSLSRVWLCNPMNRSTPGLPVHHQLPEFIQTHVHRVDDAIQPSHPLSSPSPPAPIPPSIRVFSKESTLLMRWPKYLSLSFSIIPSKEHPGLISFRMDWLIIRDTQIKITVRYHLTPNRTAIIKKTRKNKHWWGCGEKRTLIHWWLGCKLVQSLWKTV